MNCSIQSYTAPYRTDMQCILMNCTELRCIELHCIALHCIALHCTELHCTSKHWTVMNSTALHCTSLHCITMHWTALHYTSLHCTIYTVQNILNRSKKQKSAKFVKKGVSFYWYYYQHTARETVSPVCGIFFLYSFVTKIIFNFQTNKTVCLYWRNSPAVLLTAVLGVCLPIVQGAIKGANVWLLCSITLS